MIRFWKTLLGAAIFVPSLAAANAITVYKTATCGCCAEWVRHMEQAGFEPTVLDLDGSALLERKRRLGIEQRLSSCHTATVNDYVVEGHVPSTDVERLLDERLDIAGIAVPGMPVGSPGMAYGQQSKRFDVFAFDERGRSRVFARH